MSHRSLSGIKLGMMLGILTAFNLLTNLVIQWYVLVVLGPGIQTDALFASLTLPQIVVAVVSGSAVFVLVPLLTGLTDSDLRYDFWSFMWLILGFFSIVALLITLTADWWLGLLFPGFDAEGLALTGELTRIQAMAMVLTAASSMLRALHHSQRRFILAEAAPLVSSIGGLLLSLWALPRLGIVSIAWIMLFRSAAQIGFLLRHAPTVSAPRIKRPSIQTAWRRLRPLLIGAVYYKLDPLVDRFFASATIAGGLSLYYLAQQLYSIMLQVFTSATATPVAPTLAAAAREGNWERFRQVYRQKLAVMFCIPLVAYLAFLVFGLPVLNVLVGHGQVTAENVGTLWLLMAALVGVPLAGSTGQILSTAFYARGDTTTPTRVGITGFTAGVVFKVIGFFHLGLLGIAIGTTLYYGCNAIAMLVILERDLKRVVAVSAQA